jgi:hypothetical protein
MYYSKINNIPMAFVGFLLGISKFKMTSTTLDISFHIDLGRFVGH